MIRALFAVVALLVALTLGILFLLEDPNRYQSQLTQTVQANTGYYLDIKGEIGWRLWPPLALEVSEASLSTSAANEPFAQIGVLDIDVDLLPVLQQQDELNINDLQLRDVTLTLSVNENGQTNWQVEDTDTPSQATSDTTDTTASASITPKVQQLSLSNIQVIYRDLQSDDHYEMTIDELTTTALQKGTPFTAGFRLQLVDQTNAASISGNGEFTVTDETITFADTSLTSSVTLDEERLPEVTAKLVGQYRRQQSVLTLKQADIALPDLNIAAPLNVSLAGDAPQIRGEVSMQSNNISEAASHFDADVPFKAMNLTARLIGTPDRFRLAEVSGNIDASQLNGSISVLQATVPTVSVDFRVDQIDSTNYLDDPAPVATPATTATPTTSAPTTSLEDTQIIPVDLLDAMNTDSVIRVAKLDHNGKQFDNVKIEIANQDEVFALLVSAKGLGGNILASLDTSPSLNSDIKVSLDGLDVTQLSEMQGLTGRLKGHASLRFEGSQLSDLDETISGNTVFTVEDGTLDVRPLKRMALSIDTMRGKRSRISDWPDQMPFDHLVGEHILDYGLRQGQFFNFELENIKVNGHGGISLAEETLNFRVTTMFDERNEGPFKVSEQLAGIRWPMSCSGPFTASPGDLCFGEEGAIANLVGEVIKQDLKRRGQRKLEEAIEEKVPKELQDLLKGLLKRD